MSQGKLKLIFVTALVILLAFTATASVWANSELDDKRDELGELQDEMKEAERKKKELENNMAAIRAEIEKLDRELIEQRRKVREINDSINSTEKEIRDKEQEIAETEAYLEEQTGYLENRMVALYQRGNVGYLEVLFSATSFSDFISRFNFLRTMVEDDVRLVEEIKVKKEFLETEKVEQVKRRDRLVTMRTEAVSIQKSIEGKMAEQRKLNEQLHRDVQLTKAYIDELEKASQEVERQIKEMLERLARENASRGEATGTFTWPVPGYGAGWITSPYGWRTHPITGLRAFHTGIDVGIPRNRWEASPTFNGSPVNVVAADGGVVVFAGFNQSVNFGYGLYIIVDHGGGVMTLYAHLNRFLVQVGQSVAKGQPIGTVGSTGNSTGPHLHYEVRVNGQHVNPMSRH